MAKANTNRNIPIYTHEGAVATATNKENELRRSIMACLLWEDEFYESGEAIAERIAKLVPQVDPDKVAEMAVEAREKMKLRHVPLLVVREMARHNSHKHLVKDTLARILQRADEPAEFLKIYWKNGRQPIAAQVKKGIAEAFTKFDAYQLAKYNRDAEIKLRDVLFLTHPKPTSQKQTNDWKQLIDGTLAAPDTWEVSLSAGADKKTTFERLIQAKKLGAMALLRNLRNMEGAGVDKQTITDALDKMNVARVLPFRFLTAAKHAPGFETEIENAFYRCTSQADKLPGKTILVIDVSGSMYGYSMSRHSELNRAQIASSLAPLARELCEDVAIYATAGTMNQHKTAKVPARRGFALSDAIYEQTRPLGGGGIFLKQCLDYIKAVEKTADRIIVITDEQDCDHTNRPNSADAFGKHNYVINVASYQNGVSYNPKWCHIDGFSEAVINYIREYEKL